MFSPDAVVSASASTRNPRRRQRTGSEDSVALRHHPKRIRRSILNPETFQPVRRSERNGHAGHVAEEHRTNGHAKEPGNQRHTSGDATSLALRHRTQKEDRERKVSRDDGSIELVMMSCDIMLSIKSLKYYGTDQERELCCDPAINNTTASTGLRCSRYRCLFSAPYCLLI